VERWVDEVDLQEREVVGEHLRRVARAAMQSAIARSAASGEGCVARIDAII
jgi:hypothetical protein